MDNEGNTMKDIYEGLGTTDWSDADHALYKEWNETLAKPAYGPHDWYEQSACSQWLDVVWEKGIYPTEVSEWLATEAEFRQ